MPMDRFMIAPIRGGLETDVKPWMVPNDAMAQMDNAYIFRDRIRKRFGSRLMNSTVDLSVAQLFSRVRVQVATTTGGAASGTVPGAIFKLGQLFSVLNDIFTVNNDTPGPQAMLSTGPGTGTYDVSNGNFVITGTGAPDSTPVYFYPAEPIMGLPLYEVSDTLNDPTFAFDTQFAYQYTAGAWSRLAAGTSVWTGNNSQFFWTTNWQGATPSVRRLFVTNNVQADGIRYWDGTTWTATTFTINAAGDTLLTSLIVVVYQNRLIALNTLENVSSTPTRFTNRARWAAFGDPTAMNAWRQDIPGQGNALDAATMEDIVSVEFIKNRLIVFFESSTWELAFTNNQAQPFVWQKLNTELGCESPWSVVPFDKVALAVGNVGIHACNGVNVERIDQKIPDTVWTTRDGSDQSKRVYGIRDYYAEQVYWTFPSITANPFSTTFPNRILVYNYPLDAWAFNDDSITAFGYFYLANSVSAITWDSQDINWDNTTVTWDSGASQVLSQNVLAGNQEGFVFIVNPDLTANAPALQITDIYINGNNQVELIVTDHNLNTNATDDASYIYLEFLNGLTGPFTSIYPVVGVSDADTIQITAPDVFAALALGQVYTGGGTIARISQIDILTKQFNFYIDKDRNSQVQKIDFLVDRTDSGEITVDYKIGSSSQGSLAGAQATGAQIGTNVLETSPYDLYPAEQTQDRLWHPVYTQADGNAVQLRIYLSDVQLQNFNIATSNLQIHAMTFYCQPTTQRAQ